MKQQRVVHPLTYKRWQTVRAENERSKWLRARLNRWTRIFIVVANVNLVLTFLLAGDPLPYFFMILLVAVSATAFLAVDQFHVVLVSVLLAVACFYSLVLGLFVFFTARNLLPAWTSLFSPVAGNWPLQNTAE